MEVPDFMDCFELNLNNTRAYSNLVDNCTILVRQNNGKLLLTILVNNKKFKNEYLCRDKEFECQRELEEYLESVMWNTDLTENLKIKKKENKINSNGEHKVIQIDKQNVGKVLTTLTEQQQKIRKQKYFEEKQRETVHKEHQNRHKKHKEASENEQKTTPTIPKREGFSIAKKKNATEKPIAPVSGPSDGSKMSLDQFGSVKEALKAIKDKLQKESKK
jgi:hypothetical protein